MPMAVLPDAEIYYEIVGQGPPLLLVAGLGGAGAYWRPNLAALAERYSVIVYDHRGCGRSTRSTTSTSVEGMADDLVLLMNAIGLDRAILVGHSTGGAIGQVIAARTPERVEKLVLYASWAVLCPQMRQCMDLRQQTLRLAGPAAYHRASVVFLYPPRFTCENWPVLDGEVTMAARDSSAAAILDARINAIVAFDGTSYLPAITAPTAIIVAQDDILTPPLASEVLASGIRGARLMILPYGGHAISRVVPELFNSTLLSLLEA